MYESPAIKDDQNTQTRIAMLERNQTQLRGIVAAEILKFRKRLSNLAECYPCTCHEAYSGRDMHDPDCQAYQFGDDLRAELGEAPKCQAAIKFSKRLKATKEGTD